MIVFPDFRITWIFLGLIIRTLVAYKSEQTIRRGPGSDPQCMSPLLSSSDEFPDSAFSASSVWDNLSDFQPYRARLTEVYGSKEHTSGYAWCPNSKPNDESLREWIQAEFPHLVMITTIFTTGRGDGNVKEFMPSFVLKYQREDDGPWFVHVKRDGTRILKANSDPRNIARATLDSIVVAKRIRIYPYSERSNLRVCLRFALYGCQFPDGVVSYSMPQGDTNKRIGSLFVPYDFRDQTYDGESRNSNGELINGLGQLMDNVAYLGNVTVQSDSNPSQPGYHFVGWQKIGTNSQSSDLQIVFKFDQVRNFTWLRLFTFGSIPLQARLFDQALVRFSLDGVNYGKSVDISTRHARIIDPNNALYSRTNVPGELKSMRSKRNTGPISPSGTSSGIGSNGGGGGSSISFTSETIIYANQEWDGALVVQMPLGNHIGRYVILTLSSSDTWIFLSEIQFNSTIANMTIVQSMKNNEPPADTLVDTNAKDDDKQTLPLGGESNRPDDGKQSVPEMDQKSKIPTSLSHTGADPYESSKHEPGSRGSNTNLIGTDSRLQNNPYDMSDQRHQWTGVVAVICYVIVSFLSFCLLLGCFIFIHLRRRRSQREHRHKQLVVAGNTNTTHAGNTFSGTTNPEAAKLLRQYPVLTPTNHRIENSHSTGPPNPANNTNLFTMVSSPTTDNTIGSMANGTNFGGTCHIPKLDYPSPMMMSNCTSNAISEPMTGLGIASSIGMATQQNPTGNIYSGSDLNGMSGFVSLTSQPNMQPYLMPAYLVVPTSSSSTNGGYLFRPIGGCPDPPLSSGYSRPGIETPDSGSLYTSIRNSIFQTGVNSSILSGPDSEQTDHDSPVPFDSQNPSFLRTNPSESVNLKHLDEEKSTGHDDGEKGEAKEGHILSHENSPKIESLEKNSTTNPPNDDTQTKLINTTKDDSNREIQAENDESKQVVIEVSGRKSNPNSSILTRPKSKSSRPLSQQFSSTQHGNRNSILSLPDGEETQSYILGHHYQMYKPRSFSFKENIPMQFIQPRQVVPYFVIPTYGPEYASASLFGFTPPPSDIVGGGAAANSTATKPTPSYRPFTPPFAFPLGTGMNSIYAGPASVPIKPPPMQGGSGGGGGTNPTQLSPTHLPSTVQQTSGGGLLFLPQSNLGGPSQFNGMALPNNFQQPITSNPTGLVQSIGSPYHIYQAARLVMPNQGQFPVQSPPPPPPLPQQQMGVPNDKWIPHHQSQSSSGSEHLGPQLDRFATNAENPWSTINNMNYKHALMNGGGGTLRNRLGPADSNMGNFRTETLGRSHQGNFYSNQLVYPPLPPPPPTPASDSQVNQPNNNNNNNNNTEISRGSPVGAAAVGTGGYVIGISDPNNRDGTSSGRLSLYSVCI